MASQILFHSREGSRIGPQLVGRRFHQVAAFTFAVVVLAASAGSASAQQAYGGQNDYIRPRNYPFPSSDWNRFYHYPYVFYPHNYYADAYMQSAEDLYHRYPQEMRVPVYNRRWQNYYPKARRYHQGHHFKLDVF